MRLYDADDDNVKPGNLVRDIDDLLLRGIEAQHQQSLNLIVICQAGDDQWSIWWLIWWSGDVNMIVIIIIVSNINKA